MRRQLSDLLEELGQVRHHVPDAQDADRALGLVDFTLYPHLNHPDMEDTDLSHIQKWALGIPVPTYAIDDEPDLGGAVSLAVGLLAAGGVCVLEHASRRAAPEAAGAAPTRRLVSGDSALAFYGR